MTIPSRTEVIRRITDRLVAGDLPPEVVEAPIRTVTAVVDVTMAAVADHARTETDDARLTTLLGPVTVPVPAATLALAVDRLDASVTDLDNLDHVPLGIPGTISEVTDVLRGLIAPTSTTAHAFAPVVIDARRLIPHHPQQTEDLPNAQREAPDLRTAHVDRLAKAAENLAAYVTATLDGPHRPVTSPRRLVLDVEEALAAIRGTLIP